MKQLRLTVKAMSVLLAFFFSFISVFGNGAITASAIDDLSNYDKLSTQEKQAYLEQQLKEVNQKLGTLSKESTETEEYINALDKKISYLQKELRLAKTSINNSKEKIDSLEKQYDKNEEDILQLNKDIKSLEKRMKSLQSEYNESYELYAKRAKALYISGGDLSTLAMLLTSEDLSTFFTRLEMIKRVSKADKIILENLQNEGEELIEARDSLEDKQETLTETQESLASTKDNLKETIKTLETQQTNYNQKESAYKEEKQEADRLLEKLQADTKTYSEYRNEDLEALEEVNREIERAAEEFRKKMESSTTTTTTKKHTTTTTTTTAPTSSEDETNDNEEGSSSTKPTTTKKATTTTTTKKTTTQKTTASNKLSMTYPVPSQKTITTDYGSAGYEGHTGVDFACDSGSKVVAAESGYVIISTDLKNADGSYRSYGRYIVIAHDKKNSAGNYVYTLYAHNSSRVVSEGDYVKKGQLIAYSGSTGNSSGPHCHFEVRTPTAAYNDCVNPNKYLP